jgi:hypothetical protein
MSNDSNAQPKHTPTGIEAMLCDVIASRQQLGIAKYGTTLANNPAKLDAWARNLLEELLDGAAYAMRLMVERKTAELLKWHPATTHPDSDITVLCWGADGMFTGYWEAEREEWIDCESGAMVLGVTHWAQPEGPA